MKPDRIVDLVGIHQCPLLLKFHRPLSRCSWRNSYSPDGGVAGQSTPVLRELVPSMPPPLCLYIMSSIWSCWAGLRCEKAVSAAATGCEDEVDVASLLLEEVEESHVDVVLSSWYISPVPRLPGCGGALSDGIRWW